MAAPQMTAAPGVPPGQRLGQRRRTRGKFSRDNLLRGCSAWSLNREVNDDFGQGLQRSIEERVQRNAIRGAGTAGGTGGSYEPRPSRKEDDSSESDFEEPPPLSVPKNLNVKSWEELNMRLAAISWQRGEEGAASTRQEGLVAPQKPDEPRQATSRSWVISPRSPWKRRWDVFTGGLVVYTVMMLPLQIGFDRQSSGGQLIFDYCVDALFAVDTFSNFFVGYYNHQEVYTSDRRLIARRYLAGFFVPDVLSWMPLDIMIQGITGGNSNSVRLIKFVRLVRLVKLMRLLKLSRFVRNLGERLNLNPSAVELVKLMMKIIFLAHLLACVWHFIALPTCGDENGSNDHACPEPEPEGTKVVSNWVRSFGADHFGMSSRYIAATHFVVATMMAVGYGDIYATNTIERIVSICMQCLGATAFGFILAAVTALVDSSNLQDTDRRKRKAEIKEWMNFRRLPMELRCSIREHIHYANGKRSQWASLHEAPLLDCAPTVLRDQIVEDSYGRYLACLRTAFSEEDMWLLGELTLELRASQVVLGEVVLEAGEISNEVHIVLSGVLQMVLEPRARSLAELGREDWVRNCLTLGSDGSLVPNYLLSAAAEGGEPVEETQGADNAVLCGFLRHGELLGTTSACPMTVCGGNKRCELLSLPKESLLHVISKVPGAEARFLEREKVRERELLKVLAAADMLDSGAGGAVGSQSPRSERSGRTVVFRPIKELVLLGGRAAPPDSLPTDLQAMRSRSVDNERLKWSTESTSSVGSAATGSRSPVHQLRTIKPPTSKPSRLTNGEEPEEAIETESEILARYIIPPYHRHKFRWDCFVGVLIIYSALTIPFRVGMDVDKVGVEIAIDVLVDLFFCVDMVLNFRTGFVDVDGLINTVPSQIRSQYLKTWFGIDLCSTVPVDQTLELVALASGSDGSGRSARALKMFKTLRLLRLLKLARLLKMGRLVKSFEEVVEVPPILVKCFKLSSQLVILAHVIGCFWFFMSTHQDATVDGCASGLLGCSPNDLATTWWEEIDITSDDKGEQYIASLYWAFTTMTTVGYGDITPKNNYERLYAVMAMLLGAPIFGYIVGSIAALAGQNNSTFEAQGKKRVGTVLEFCDEQQVGKRYRERVHNHYQFLYQQRAPHLEPHLLASLAGPLRKEVTVFISRHAISKICLFVGARPSDLPDQLLPRWFVAWAMRLLEPQTAANGQDILNADDQAAVHEIFFVYEGYCEAYLHTPRCIDRARSLHLESIEISSIDQQDDAQVPSARLSEGTQHRRERAKSPETLGSGRGGSDASANSDIGGAAPRASSTSSTAPRALMVFGPGSMFGPEYHLDRRLRFSVRCGKKVTCLLYVLRQSAIVEVAHTVPEMASAVRSAVTSALIRQMKLRSSDYDWIRQRPERVRGSGSSYAEPPAAMKPVLPTAFSSPSSPLPLRP